MKIWIAEFLIGKFCMRRSHLPAVKYSTRIHSLNNYFIFLQFFFFFFFIQLIAVVVKYYRINLIVRTAFVLNFHFIYFYLRINLLFKNRSFFCGKFLHISFDNWCMLSPFKVYFFAATRFKWHSRNNLFRVKIIVWK